NKIIKNLIDKNQDGKPDVEAFFDKNQNRKKLISDLDFDGYFETVQTYNNPAWSMILSQDINADKNTDVKSFYSNNILKQKELDDNSDGIIDCIEYYHKTGTIEKLEEMNNGKIVITWFYDDKETVIRAQEDKNSDGMVDIWYQYDDKGILKSVEEDTNLDGKPDLWEEYDETQAVVKREKDLDFDGMADFVDVNVIAKTGTDS
ncbi:MAG: hypothetical protein KAR45_15220, partial [Desulfobacteraceae bacterium]|nr:hypothetical protein [Desulfobacteraceae bacterium]